MKSIHYKPFWFIAAMAIVALFIALSYSTKKHIDYATGRIRTSQSIAGFMFNPNYEDTWITPFVSTEYESNWHSIHTNGSLFGAATLSKGSRIRSNIWITENILNSITTDDESRKLIARAILDSLNQSQTTANQFPATIDSFECLRYKIPRPPPLDRVVTFEEISAIVNECFPMTQPE